MVDVHRLARLHRKMLVQSGLVLFAMAGLMGALGRVVAGAAGEVGAAG